MKWDLITGRLTAAFTEVRLAIPAGRVLVAKKPVDFQALLQEAAETDDEESDLDTFTVEEFLASRRPLKPLFDFDWHAGHLSLEAFDAGDHRLYFGLPEATINHVPHLVPRRVVLEAYWAWMPEVSPELWLHLFASVVKEPPPPDLLQALTRTYAEVSQLAGLKPQQRGTARHISAYLAHVRAEVARMPVDLRGWVLETYLQRTYGER